MQLSIPLRLHEEDARALKEWLNVDNGLRGAAALELLAQTKLSRADFMARVVNALGQTSRALALAIEQAEKAANGRPA